MPVFQVVRFPNDGCEVAGGSRNGTCYTASVYFCVNLMDSDKAFKSSELQKESFILPVKSAQAKEV